MLTLLLLLALWVMAADLVMPHTPIRQFVAQLRRQQAAYRALATAEPNEAARLVGSLG